MTLTKQLVAEPSLELMTTRQLKEAWLNAEFIEFGDPVHAHTPFPFHMTCFPLGFPVAITTDSLEVLEIADQAWGTFTRLFDRKPIRLDIGVKESDCDFCPPAPEFRMRNHLVTNSADGENLTVSDLADGSSIIWVTQAALRHPDYFRYCFLQSAALVQISSRYATGIHAACVAHDGNGVLLCGDSGAGKSTLSYACARAGWTYITDDGSYLVHDRTDRLVAGNCTQVRFRPSAEALFPEIAGMPVMRRAGAGKPSMEMPVAASAAIGNACTANIEHVVFLKRGVAAQELVPFPRAVARLFMQQRVHCMPFRVQEQMAAIDRLLTVETYELRYNDLDWAIGELARLAGESRA